MTMVDVPGTQQEQRRRLREAPALVRVGGVPVAHWNPVRDGAPVNNFGDVLGPTIVSRLVARWGLEAPEPGPADPTRLLVGTGSVLHLAPAGSVVWGTGVNGKKVRESWAVPPGLDVRAVRGPWTARLLRERGLEVPEVYGDPGMLLPYAMPELVALRASATEEVLVAPNLNDRSELGEQAAALGLPVLDPVEHLDLVLRRIATSGLVVGTSLHAIVVADALGVPARLVRSEHEPAFKYRDYLAGTGRWTEPVAPTVASALELGPHPAADLDRDALLEAFPADLWSAAFAARGQDLRPRTFDDAATSSAWLRRVDPREPAAAPGAEVADYVAELEAVIDGADDDADGLERRSARLVERRRWLLPDVDPSAFPDRARVLDAAVREGVPRTVRTAAALARGTQVTVTASIRSVLGTVVSLLVRPDPVHGAVRGVGLVGGPGAERTMSGMRLEPGLSTVDVDVVAPPSWFAPGGTEVMAVVVYTDGVEVECPGIRLGTRHHDLLAGSPSDDRELVNAQGR